MTFEEFCEKYEVETLPQHMWPALYRYICKGIPMGSFGSALMADELVGSFCCADEDNLRAMKAWASWLYSRCPRGAWGSEERMRAWIADGGLNGIEERD